MEYFSLSVRSIALPRDELLNRISINPQVYFGKPCIKGRRIWVALVLDFLASGMSMEGIMEEYDIEREDVLACIAYGAEMSRERYIDIPVEAAP
jgi:uncharacterized protein (DUF433 family)